MPYECTWWEYTGENTPFDKHGISRALWKPLGASLDTALVATQDLPIGALFASPTQPGHGGSDSLVVTCVLPTLYHWVIDGRASNCDQKDDKAHRCWVRHGSVGDRLTVDKNGHTCGAGAGSIAVPGYHGFLRDGWLTDG
jgi:hypothetical protein